MAAAWGLDPAPGANSIEKTFGAPFDPWLNDETFTASVLSLEELGATGNKARRLLCPGFTGAGKRLSAESVASCTTCLCLHKAAEFVLCPAVS